MHETENSRLLGTSAIERKRKRQRTLRNQATTPSVATYAEDRPWPDVLEVAALGHELQPTFVDRVDDAEGDEKRRAELQGVAPDEPLRRLLVACRTHESGAV